MFFHVEYMETTTKILEQARKCIIVGLYVHTYIELLKILTENRPPPIAGPIAIPMPKNVFNKPYNQDVRGKCVALSM